MTDESLLKENIVQLMSEGSGEGVVSFLKTVAHSKKITYADELKYLDSKINLVSKYNARFSILLTKSSKVLVSLKKRSYTIERKLKSPKLTSKEKSALIKEYNENDDKLGLVEKEIEHLRKMYSVLDDISIDHKESLSRIKRKIERSSVNE